VARLAPEQVIKFAVKEAFRLLRPDVAMLHLQDGPQLLLGSIHPQSRRFGHVGKGLHPVGQCLCGLAARKRQPVYSINIFADARCTLPECRQAGVRSFAAVPLVGRKRVLGVLSVASLRERDFRVHATFLEALGAEVSIALRNALLHEQVRRHAVQLTREVARRQKAEGLLRKANADLERRVAERTATANRQSEQMRHLAAELAQAEQHERARIARVLHEEVQQLLVAAQMRLASARKAAASSTGRRQLLRSSQALYRAVHVCRSLTTQLCPPVLYDLGLASALKWLRRRMLEQHDLKVDVQAEPAAQPRSQTMQAFLFEAGRELLFNVVKHAGTASAQLRLRKLDGQAVLEVIDQGKGFRSAGARRDYSSFGLVSLAQRASALGGRLDIHSAPGKGTRVRLAVPLTS